MWTGRFTKGWVRHRQVWTGAENLATNGTGYTHNPLRTDSLYRLSHHGPASPAFYQSKRCIYTPVFLILWKRDNGKKENIYLDVHHFSKAWKITNFITSILRLTRHLTLLHLVSAIIIILFFFGAAEKSGGCVGHILTYKTPVTLTCNRMRHDRSRRCQ